MPDGTEPGSCGGMQATGNASWWTSPCRVRFTTLYSRPLMWPSSGDEPHHKGDDQQTDDRDRSIDRDQHGGGGAARHSSGEKAAKCEEIIDIGCPVRVTNDHTAVDESVRHAG
jgi:hypothetical protein